jgi:uncharacterized membrane protein HdeD (DUF308 family)
MTMAEIIPVPGSSIRYWWVFILRGLLFLIVGFLPIFYPLESYVTLSILFGVTILITGIIELIYALSDRKIKGWGWRLFAAIIDIVLGIILISNIRISLAVLPFFVGFWFFFRGITMLTLSRAIKNNRSTWWLITGGVLLIVFSFLIIINPVFGALTIIIWTAIGCITAGIFSIILAFRLKRTKTKGGIYEIQ